MLLQILLLCMTVHGSFEDLQSKISRASTPPRSPRSSTLSPTDDELSTTEETSTTPTDDEPSTTEETSMTLSTDGHVDKAKEDESRNSLRLSKKQTFKTFYLGRGDFRTEDQIEQAGGFTAKYNHFVRLVLLKNDDMADETFQSIHDLLEEDKSSVMVYGNRNMQVSRKGKETLKKLQDDANVDVEESQRKNFSWMSLHVNQNYRAPDGLEVVGVLEGLSIAFDKVLGAMDTGLDDLRKDKTKYLIEDCIHGKDEDAKKLAAYGNFFDLLKRKSLTSVAMGHMNTNWPEFISTGNSEAEGDLKGEHIYQIIVDVREITNDLKSEWKKDRRKELCRVWINAKAKSYRDADVLLFSNGRCKDIEIDFVYKIPNHYIKYMGRRDDNETAEKIKASLPATK
jgi:hypothetical protein